MITGFNVTEGPESSAPAKDRFTDPVALRAVYDHLTDEDRTSAAFRGKIRRLYDGFLPYDPKELERNGLKNLANINFKGLQGTIDNRASVILKLTCDTADLVQLLPRSREFAGPDVERVASVIAEEFSATLREGGEIVSALASANKEADLYGIGPVVWPNDTDYLPVSLERGALRFDPDGPVNSSRHDIFMFESTLPASFVFSLLDDPAGAEEAGWNIACVKEWIVRVFGRGESSEAQASVLTGTSMIEEAIARHRERRTFETRQFEKLHVLHCYVREESFPRMITHYIMPPDERERFMFVRKNAYARMDQALMWFSYSVTEHTARAVRGLASTLAPFEIYRNQLLCHILDIGYRAGSYVTQEKTPGGLSRSTFSEIGPYVALPAGLSPVNQPIGQNLQAVLGLVPFIDQQAVATATGKHRAPLENPEPSFGSDRMTKEQVKQMAANQSRKDEALFVERIMFFDKVFRESFRRFVRIATAPALAVNYPEVLEFLARCDRRNVPVETVARSPEIFSVITNRDLVLGSEGKYGVLMELLQTIGGNLDEAGRRLATRDMVRLRLGTKAADRYTPEQTRDQQPGDAQSFATVENGLIKAGLPVMVGVDQYHWAHIPVHAQLLSEVKQQVAQGLPEGAQVKLEQDDENRISESDIDPELLAAMPDPDGLMRTLVAAMEHVRQHAQYGGAQIGMQDAAKGVERMLKNMAPTIKALNLAIATRQRVMQAQAEAEERERAELEKRADETEFRKEARRQDLDHQVAMRKVELDAEIQRAKLGIERENADLRNQMARDGHALETEKKVTELEGMRRMQEARLSAANTAARLTSQRNALGLNTGAPEPEDLAGSEEFPE